MWIFRLGWILGLSASSLGATQQAPNVLLICVDDLKPTIGAFGDPLAKTPNMDRLAERGIIFEKAYCNQAVCSPSRNSLMLGTRSTSLGIYDLSTNFRQSVPNAVTLSQYFKQQGYHASAVGKIFHTGHGNREDEASWSEAVYHDKVVEYRGETSGEMSREEAYFSNAHLGRIRELPKGKAWESVATTDEDYADGRIAVESIRRLEAAKAKPHQPFFLAVGFVKPHLPFTPPQKYWDLYRREDFKSHPITNLPKGAPALAGKRGGEINNYDLGTDAKAHELPEETAQALLHGYYASVSYMDAQLGKVLDALDRLELRDNTIIALWGDHGWHLGDLGIWTKHTNYEQANRIPILLVAPQHFAGGKRTQHLAETVDLFPTLTSLAGLPAPQGKVAQPIEGVDLTPLLQAEPVSLKDHVYHAFPRGEVLGRAIRTDRYRLVEWRKPGAPASTAEYELYDYSESQVELENLYDLKPEVAKSLQSILAIYPEAKTKRDAEDGAHPVVANRALRISAEVLGNDDAQGIILSHGGSTQGYALRLEDKKLIFELRRSGTLHTWSVPWKSRGELSQKLVVELHASKVKLQLEGVTLLEAASPGLLSRPPREAFVQGADLGSLVGDYAESRSFSGEILRTEVQALQP